MLHTVFWEDISFETARTQQQIIGHPCLYYSANSFYSAGGYPCYTLTGEPQSFPSWMATVYFSSHKAVVWSTAVLPTLFSQCLMATEHCCYNDGKCCVVIHNPQELCTFCRNSPKWKCDTSLLLGHQWNYDAVPTQVSSFRELLN